MQETWVQPLGREDSPEKEVTPHCSIFFFSLLQYSCLGNPMDRGAYRAIVHGITELDATYATKV